MKEYLLVSSCLGGHKTKYNAGHNKMELIEKLSQKYHVIYFCPEVAGGLPIPRDPSEIKNQRVFSKKKKDVTKEFFCGAQSALKIVLKYNIKKAVLKDGSPSCGSEKIYDGSFEGKKIEGKGYTTQLLDSHNITIYTESTAFKLL